MHIPFGETNLSARSFVNEYRPMVKQLGATSVELYNDKEIRLGYDNGNDAAMARSVFEDAIGGAKLIIDDPSTRENRPLPTPEEVADFIGRLPDVGVSVGTLSFRKTLLIGSSSSDAYIGLRHLLRSYAETSDGPLPFALVPMSAIEKRKADALEA